MPQIDAALIHAAVLDDGRQQVDKAYIFAEGGGGGSPYPRVLCRAEILSKTFFAMPTSK